LLSGVYGSRFLSGMGSILVNGVSILDKPNLLRVIMSKQILSVYSKYSIRQVDLDLIYKIAKSMRKGYLTLFRIGSIRTDILAEEDLFAYQMLEKLYDTIFPLDANATLEQLYTLSTGGTISVTHESIGSPLNILVEAVLSESDIVNSPITLTQNGNKVASEGSIIVECGSSDVVTAVYGNLLETAVLVDWAAREVLLYHTQSSEELVLYYARKNPIVGLQGQAILYTVTISLKTTAITIGEGVSMPLESVQNYLDWGAVPPTIQETSNIVHGDYVTYSVAELSDGSFEVTYEAFDKDGNIITPQFQTLSLGSNFLHKEMM